MEYHPIRYMVQGRFTPSSPTDASKELTNDWFGQWLSAHPPEHRPRTLRDLLTKVLPARTWVPFAVGDGTHLRYAPENNHIPRALRLTIVATPENVSTTTQHPGIPDVIVANIDDIIRNAFNPATGTPNPTLFISGSYELDAPERFLQVASWGINAESNTPEFRFYQREGQQGYGSSNEPQSPEATSRPPLWAYLGASSDAFEPDTAGKGPFCGHVNGALVMKELSVPWIHWHSSTHRINNSFHPDAAIRNDPLLGPGGALGFSFVVVADRLEQIVRTSIRRWYESRISRDFGPPGNRKDGKNVRHWMRHLLSNTTFNIIGAAINSEAVVNNKPNSNFFVPSEFFMSDRVLPDLLGDAGDEIQALPRVQVEHYNQARIKLGLASIYRWSEDPQQLGVAFEHEGQVPWAIMVPSFEDSWGINRIHHTSLRLLSAREVCSFLMIDFPNPVYSRRREQLMKYVPDESSRINGVSYDLGERLRERIAQSSEAQDPESPESEYLRNLQTNNYQREFAARIDNYLKGVAARLQTPEGVEDYMRVAESRRRMFRPHPGSQGEGTNRLSEFKMTLPFARNIPATEPWLEMAEDGTIRAMNDEGQHYVKQKIADRYKGYAMMTKSANREYND